MNVCVHRQHLHMDEYQGPNTPGAVIRRHRERLMLTQRELGQRCRLSQGRLSEYELGCKTPTWAVLTRALAVMGMRPVVDAVDCDVSAHAETVELRLAGADLRTFGPVTWLLAEPGQMLAPDLDADIADVLQPVATMLGSLTYALTGDIGRRATGARVEVSQVDAVVYDVSIATASHVCDVLLHMSSRVNAEFWDPHSEAFRCVFLVDELAAMLVRGRGTLRMRTRPTATTIVLSTDPGPRPACTQLQIGEAIVPVSRSAPGRHRDFAAVGLNARNGRLLDVEAVVLQLLGYRLPATFEPGLVELLAKLEVGVAQPVPDRAELGSDALERLTDSLQA